MEYTPQPIQTPQLPQQNTSVQSETQPASAEAKEKTGRRPLYFIVGVCVLVLSVVGAISLISLTANRFSALKKQKEQEIAAEYNRFLIPVAAIDMTPFDDISTAQPESLVELAVWSVLGSSPDPASFSYAEDGSLLLPVATVEQAFAGYFGPGAQIVHSTVEGYGYEFLYDAANNAYRIPLTTITPIYTPRVTEVEIRGDATVLTCGFVSSGVYEQDPVSGDLKAPAPDKYMKITLRSVGGSNVLSAVQTVAAPESAPILSTTTEPAKTEDAATSSGEGEDESAVDADTETVSTEEASGEIDSEP